MLTINSIFDIKLSINTHELEKRRNNCCSTGKQCM